MTDRKKPGVAFWASMALVVVLVGYPLSFGPACWITSRCSLRGAWISTAYRPLIRSMEAGPGLTELTVPAQKGVIPPVLGGFAST